MKRVWIVVVGIALIFMSAPAASAEGALMPAARPFDEAVLEKYASYALDESGNFSVCANEVAPALSLFADEAGRYSDGLAYFYLELTGNARTGVMVPVINVLYTGRQAAGARAFSLRIGDVRLDFAAAESTDQVGGRTVQRLRAFVGDAERAALAALSDADEVRLRIHGSEAYTATIRPAARHENARDQVQALSVASIRPMLDAFEALGGADYALWDLSAARWEAEYGWAPRVERVPVTGEAADVAGVVLDAPMNMLSPGARGKSVEALQNQLIAMQLLTGRADGRYGASMRTAVYALQRYMGRVETGSADAGLIQAIMSDAVTPAPIQTEPLASPSGALGAAWLDIDRAWLADALTARYAQSEMAQRSALNRDNVLLIADGLILNGGTQALEVSWQMSAAVSNAAGQSYPCTLVIERDRGTGLGEVLIPGASARLIAYAEIPRAARPDGWTLTISYDEATLTYPIGG